MAATQSAPPSYPPDENPSTNSALQPTEDAAKEGQATVEPSKEISPKSVFVNSESIREEQVQNAIKFLSHPRVRGSPVVHRRNFLERKGLTKEEIDEAFRRVPDQSPAVANGQTSTYQDGQSMPSSNNQVQSTSQAMQAVTAAPSGVISTTARRFHWSHAVFAVGFLAVSGAGAAIVFKNSIIPRVKAWIRRVVLDEENAIEKRTNGKPSLAEEATTAAKAAADAAVDVAKISQEMLIVKSEEKKCFVEFITLLDMQLQEIRTMRNAVMKLEGQSYISGRNLVREEYMGGSVGRPMQQIGSKSEYDMRAVRSASLPTSAKPPHPKSYMEPWELSQPASNSSYVPQPQATTEGTNPMIRDNGVTNQFNNNDTPTPWWEQKNPRITEIENGDGPKTSSRLRSSVSIDNPMPRRWVPPQPPSVSMPEAAEAIRKPKSSTPKDHNVRAENAEQPASEADELQRITKIAEFGGQPEMNESESSEIDNSSEIQQEQFTEFV